MAFFPIYHYRHYDNPLEQYFGNQMDFFDPWYDFDTSPTTLIIVPNDFRWVNQPQRSNNSSNKTENNKQTSRTPNTEKFRVQINVAGFNPETIKTKVEGKKVIIEAKKENRQPDGDYDIREVRKSFDLPEHAGKWKSFGILCHTNHILVIEVPIENPELERRVSETKTKDQNLSQFGQHRDSRFDYHRFLSGSDFTSTIVDKDNNQKQLQMSVGMKNYKPEEIKVSVKNNELIVKGERQHKDENHSERVFFFKSTTLPPGTQVEQLQSYLTEDGQLKIEVPYVEQKEEEAKPIEGQKEEAKPIESQKVEAKPTKDQKEQTKPNEDQKQ